ncbi:MAG: LysR family transcriptional regulator [Synergistales bacterium]
MNLNQLRVFCTVVSEGGFLQASRTLYMSQPAISQHVAALEKAIGVRLFNRKGRNVSLTPEGRTLLVLAKEVLQKADGIPERFREMKELKIGKLSVGFEAHPAMTLLPPVLRWFRAEFPDIQVTIVTDRQEELLERLSSGEIEMAVAGGNRRNLPTTGVVTRSLGLDSLILVVPADHTLEGNPPLPATSLDGKPLVRYLPSCPLCPVVEDYLLQHQVKPKSDLWVDDPAVAARFVSEGICLAILNRGTLAGKAGHLPIREIPLLGLDSLSWEISVAYSTRLGLSYAGWAFEKILESESPKILKTV